MRVKHVIACWTASALVFTTAIVNANTVGNTDGWYAEVNQILTHDEAYGGCMADISPPPSSRTGVNCQTTWVSFNCLNTSKDGYIAPGKTIAQAKLSAAQLGFVARKRVRVEVMDGVKFNGHCVAYNVQNTNSDAATP